MGIILRWGFLIWESFFYLLRLITWRRPEGKYGRNVVKKKQLKNYQDEDWKSAINKKLILILIWPVFPNGWIYVKLLAGKSSFSFIACYIFWVQGLVYCNQISYLIYLPEFFSFPVQERWRVSYNDTMTRVQIMDQTNCISHSTNTLGKVMNPINLASSYG